MKNINNLEYWFTPKGGEEYRQIYTEYFELFLSKASNYEVYKHADFDIFKLNDFPFEGMCTFITKELSSYILGSNQKGFIRSELAISIDKQYEKLNFSQLLHDLATKQLENRDVFNMFEVVELEDSFFKMSKVLNAGSVWLEEELQGFSGDINTNISELFLISNTDEKLINESVDEFIDHTQKGKINILDLKRN